MHYLAEQNARRSRRHALVLAVALHLALAAVFYLYTGDKSNTQSGKSAPVKIEKERPAPKARAVNMP